MNFMQILFWLGGLVWAIAGITSDVNLSAARFTVAGIFTVAALLQEMLDSQRKK